jgi:hypothetical protein
MRRFGAARRLNFGVNSGLIPKHILNNIDNLG